MLKKFSDLAKITRPRISGIVPRTRLFNLLDRGREKPVTWISGPAGSGKTTLVGSYLDARKLQCLWYAVDEADGDIATFFYYMGLAAKRASPRSRKPLPLLTPEYRQGTATFTLRYFENLYSRLKPPCVLVFDSYQHAPSESKLHEVIREGLSIVPGGIRVILTSRSCPPPEFARLHANNKMHFVGWDELKLTLDEAREVLGNKGRQEATEEVLKILHSRTEGWAAGLVLLLEGLENKVALAALEKLKQEDIFAYFAKEIFEKCQLGMQDFLLETSFLPTMTPHMADELTGSSRARHILSELNQKNYFTQRQASESEAYQYHPLFREFLQERAQESFSHECILDVKRNAATVLEAEGYIEDAVELFRDAGEWCEVTRLILAQATLMIAHGRGKTLAAWIGRLPESICDQNPFLYYWLGISRLPDNPRESVKSFEKAFQIFRNQGNMKGIFMALSGVFDSIGYGFDNFKPFDKWLPVLSELYNEYRKILPFEIKAGIFSSMLFAAALRQPHHPDFTKWEEWVLSHYHTIQDGNMKMNILVSLELYHLFSGELKKALPLIHMHQELTSSSRIMPLALITLRDAEAFYYSFAGDVEKCSKSVGTAFNVAEEEGVHIFDYFLVGYGAGAFLSSGDINNAEAFLQDMSSCLALPLNWIKAYYQILMTWKCILLRDPTKASIHAEAGLRLAEELGMPQTEAITHLGMAIVMHELKREKKALTHISEVHAISRSMNIYQVEFRCLLAEAQFALDQGDKDRARDHLRKAMVLGKEQGYANAFYWLPSAMAGLCMEALEAGIEVDYVRNIVRKRNLIPETLPLECENWPWLFRLHTLGGFELKKDGKPIEIPQKPLSMLKALISYGGREVASEQLAYQLWTDTEGDAAHTSLEVTLHRLRRLIGSEKAIQLKAGKVSIDPHSFWVDVWALEQIYEEIAKCLKRVEVLKDRKIGSREIEDEKNEIMRLADKALGLYKGDFLPADTSCSWTLAPRQSWQSKFLRLITITGSYLEGMQQYEKAAEYFQKGLEVDCLAEEFYQHLMVCYRELGRKAEAMAVYNRCCGALSSALGVNPSSGTEAVFSSLRRHSREA